MEWKHTNKNDPRRINFYDNRECEIASTTYRPSKVLQRLRFVIMRAKKPILDGEMFPKHDEYDYFAFCTNYSENLFIDEEIIKKYRKRGQAENYIKENKYGFDLKHYPCLKLHANKAYGLIGAFAYNYLRSLSIMKNPEKPGYAKKLRQEWIHIPCMVARTARDSVFRMMTHHAVEISEWIKQIKNLQFEFG